MSAANDSRRPRVFAPDDPAIAQPSPDTASDTFGDDPLVPPAKHAPISVPTVDDLARGFRWGSLFLSAFFGLATLAAGVWFTRFVSVALARDDWVGWTAFGLAALLVFSGAILILREVVGIWRLGRLAALRKEIEAALKARDAKAERRGVARLKHLFAARPEARWGLSRLAEHERDVHDAGALAALADRELLAPLDLEARRIVLRSGKRVGVVTAMSPMAWIAMLYVLIENLRMLRALASLYGGRPGLVGAMRLGRMVITHIIATGGLALTDDLLGQFLGQDVLRRLSRRLGEGAFNGALTARLGTAAIEVCRPLPFLEAPPIRVRDLLPELLRRREAPPPSKSV